MVASRTPNRAVPLVLVGLLLVSGLAVVPTAGAAAPALKTGTQPALRVFVNGVEATATTLAKINDVVDVWAFANFTVTNNDCNHGLPLANRPSFDMNASVQHFNQANGPSLPLALTVAPGPGISEPNVAGDYFVKGHAQFTVAMSNTGVNSAPTGIPVLIEARCGEANPTAPMPEFSQTFFAGTNALTLDNVAPSVGAGNVVVKSPGHGIGARFDVVVTGESDVALYELRLHQLTGNNAPITATASTIPDETNLIASETGLVDPHFFLNLTDSNGNRKSYDFTAAGIDLRRPQAVTSVTPTLARGAAPILTFATPDADVFAFNLTVQPAGGAASTFRCSDQTTACVNRSTAGAVAWEIPSTTVAWAPNTTYAVTAVPVDRSGNGQTTTPFSGSFATLQEPAGSLVATVTGGLGGIGSTIELAFTPTRDVHLVAVNLSKFSNTVVTWGGAVPFSRVWNVTVDDTGTDAPVAADLTANLVSELGQQFPASVTGNLGSFQFDAKAPVALATPTVFAMAGGLVNLTFPAATDADARWYHVRYNRSGETNFTLLNLTPNERTDGLQSFNLTGMTNGTAHFFHVAAVDERGNVGPFSPPLADATVRTVPQPAPLVVSIDPFAVGYGASFPTVSGTWSASDALASDATKLAFHLLNPAGEYWNGASAFTAAPQRHFVTNKADGTWTSDLLKAAAASALPDGVYRVNATFLNPVSGERVESAAAHTFIRDRAPPTVPSGDKNQLPVAANAVVEAGASTLVASLNFTDPLSGLGGFRFTLVNSTLHPVKLGATVSETLCMLNEAACSFAFYPGAGTPAWGAATFRNGNVTFPVPRAPPGVYAVNVTPIDRAGNEMVLPVTLAAVGATAPQTVSVSGRIYIVPSGALQPSYRDGQVHAYVYGGYDNATASLPGQASCAGSGLVCPYSKVVVTVREAGAGGASVSRTLTAPTSTSTEPYPRAGAAGVWNWTLPNGIPIGSLNPNKVLEVSAKGYLQWGSGEAQVTTVDTGFVTVHTPITSSNLIFRVPEEDWRVNTTGSVTFNATVNANLPSGADKNAWIEWQLYRGAAAVGSPQVVFVNSTAEPVPSRPLYFFNWTVPVSTPGEYKVVAVARSNWTPGVDLGTSTRYFAFDDAARVLSAPAAQQIPARSGPLGGFWAPRAFDLLLDVQHGHANLTGLAFQLNRTIIDAGESATIQPNSENFTAIIVEPSGGVFPGGPTTTRVKARVTLPAGDVGEQFVLFVNASTDVPAPAPPQQRWALGEVRLTLDAAPPSVAYDYPQSNQTSNDTSKELQLIGFTQDVGVGVGAIEVRLVDVTDPAKPLTFHPTLTDGGSWQQGDLDVWMSSNRTKAGAFWVEHVQLVKQPRVGNQPEQAHWFIKNVARPRYTAETGSGADGSFGAIGLSRMAIYRLDVKGVDALGIAGQPQSFVVRLDAAPPKIDAAGVAGGISGPTFVKWHGEGTLTARVTDNVCVASVSLVGTGPGGAAVGPLPFRRPAGAACPETTQDPSSPLAAWTLDLAALPAATDAVGFYNYSVVATDAAGQSVESSRNFMLQVYDGTNASLVEFNMPAFAPTGTSVRVVYRNDAAGRRGPLVVSGTMRPWDDGLDGMPGNASREPDAHGSGWYVAETAEASGGGRAPGYLDLELLAGNYTFAVTPLDANWRGLCGNACSGQSHILAVLPGEAPALSLESPANGSFVGAKPTLRFRVDDPGISSTGITVSALVNGSFAPLNVTYDVRRAGGNVTGYVVTYAGGGDPFPETDDLQVKLRAVGATGRPNETVFRFKVDAAPPTVDHNVTGLRTLGNETYAVEGTLVNLTANDSRSNVSAIRYNVNRLGERAFAGPFKVPVEEGNVTIEYSAVDGAGNVARGNLTLVADSLGPSITPTSESDDVLVIVEDGASGVDDDRVTVFYAYGEAGAFQPMQATRATVNSFEAHLPGDARETGLRYYVQAYDRLGNLGELGSAASPLVVLPRGPGDADLPPVVRILNPLPDAQLRGGVTFRWEATDPELRPLDVRLTLALPNGTTEVLRANADANGSLTRNLSAGRAGPHTFIVTVSDGNATVRQQVAFTVLPGETVSVSTPLPATSQVGQTVSFAVNVSPAGKTVLSAGYVVKRDGADFLRGNLTRSAATGAYTGSFTPSEPGNYEVFVTPTYQDGSSDPPTRLGALSIGGAVAAAAEIPASVMALVALGVLVVALAAGSAFGRWRK